MTASNAAAAPYRIPRANGAPTPAGLSDLQRMADQACLPRIAQAVVGQLARVIDWFTWTGTPPLARFAAGYSVRHARRGLRLLEDLGIVDTQYRPHIASRYRINVARLHELALSNRAKIREALAHAAEERDAAEGAAELADLATVSGIVRSVLGDDQAARMGWTVRRCTRLHRDLGAPELEDWRGSWQAIAPALTEHADPPGWLWRSSEWTRRVQYCRDQNTDAQAAAKRLAELSELHPAGNLHRFGTRQAWERTPSRHLSDAWYFLTQALPLLRSSTPVRWDGPHLVIAYSDPEALLLALEDTDPAEAEQLAPGPFAITWTN